MSTVYEGYSLITIVQEDANCGDDIDLSANFTKAYDGVGSCVAMSKEPFV